MIAMTNDCKRDGRRVGVRGIGQGGRRGEGECSYFQTLKSEQYENWNTIWHQITHSDIHQNTQFSHSISLLSAWLAFKLEITSWCGNTSGRRESLTPICFYCWGHNREKKIAWCDVRWFITVTNEFNIKGSFSYHCIEEDNKHSPFWRLSESMARVYDESSSIDPMFTSVYRDNIAFDLWRFLQFAVSNIIVQNKHSEQLNDESLQKEEFQHSLLTFLT